MTDHSNLPEDGMGMQKKAVAWTLVGVAGVAAAVAGLRARHIRTLTPGGGAGRPDARSPYPRRRRRDATGGSSGDPAIWHNSDNTGNSWGSDSTGSSWSGDF
ncbi:hypothetical protein ACGFYQ_36030 [Streptomyces sp. NPDC048258]|uniref:hypothetical protein n=1 Tax=Streptomyces sp. NPDC048258 TaxID=3365527 RepID=UPI003723FEA7